MLYNKEEIKNMETELDQIMNNYDLTDRKHYVKIRRYNELLSNLGAFYHKKSEELVVSGGMKICLFLKGDKSYEQARKESKNEQDKFLLHRLEHFETKFRINMQYDIDNDKLDVEEALN